MASEDRGPDKSRSRRAVENQVDAQPESPSLAQNQQDRLADTTVNIGRDVKQSIIVVISGITLLPRKISYLFSRYLKKPYYLVLDIPWWALIVILIQSILYIAFTVIYYGSTADFLSMEWRARTASQFYQDTLKSFLFWTSILALILLIYWLAGLGKWRSRKLVFPFGMRSLRGAIVNSAILALASMLVLGLSYVIRGVVISQNYSTALARAEEVLKIGDSELARNILNHFPKADRVPPQAINKTETPETVGVIEWIPEEDEDAPVSPELSVLDSVAHDLYSQGRFKEILTTICQMSELEAWKAMLPYWRSAVYVLAHDPSMGPEKTLSWTEALVKANPPCQKFSSPFWLAVPPELAWHIDARRNDIFNNSSLGDMYGEVFFLPIKKTLATEIKEDEIRILCFPTRESPTAKFADFQHCEFDVRLLDRYLQEYPNDNNIDYARFLLGLYDEIILRGFDQNPHVYDLAFFEKGRTLFHQGEYEQAISTYQSFLYAGIFKNHPWRDDVRWRVAEMYKRLGQYKDALANLAMMAEDSDETVPVYAGMETNALYIADVLMPVDQLTQVVDGYLFPVLQPLLKYTLGERLLAATQLERARSIFEDVIEEYGSQGPVEEAVNYSELAKTKLAVIDTLEYYKKSNAQDYQILLSEYLETYESFSPFENELRHYFGLFDSGSFQPITEEYIMSRSRHYISARLLEAFINEHPDDPRVPELLIKVGERYETIASWELLPPSGDFLNRVRKQSVDAYLSYIKNFPGYDSKLLDEALEHAGILYLARCIEVYYPGSGYCDRTSVLGMRDTYKKLVEMFPEHHLANNMMNWIAWSYCYEANFPEISDEDYIEAYQNALNVYEEIARSYPEGAIGKNARDNIPIIQAKLANPSNREAAPPPVWGW
ncbi:MAG: tetratricopeptide repeat protein [Omnitrophica WOR_2 bacterium]